MSYSNDPNWRFSGEPSSQGPYSQERQLDTNNRKFQSRGFDDSAEVAQRNFRDGPQNRAVARNPQGNYDGPAGQNDTDPYSGGDGNLNRFGDGPQAHYGNPAFNRQPRQFGNQGGQGGNFRGRVGYDPIAGQGRPDNRQMYENGRGMGWNDERPGRWGPDEQRNAGRGPMDERVDSRMGNMNIHDQGFDQRWQQGPFPGPQRNVAPDQYYGNPPISGQGFSGGPRRDERVQLPVSRPSAFQQGRPSYVPSSFPREGAPAGPMMPTGDAGRPNSILFGVEASTPTGPRDRSLVVCPDDELAVRDICSHYGEIRSIRKYGNDWLMVTFYDPRPAEIAFQDLNGAPWKSMGQGIIRIQLLRPGQGGQDFGFASRPMPVGPGFVRPVQPIQEFKKPARAPIGPTCSIWVAYEFQAPDGSTFTEALSNEELADLFGRFGEIFSTKQDSRGLFSFINYTSIEAATAAWDAYTKREIVHRPDCKLKIKWGHPPPNHPLFQEISALEDERHQKREETLVVTRPQNNLFDRVQLAAAKEREQVKDRKPVRSVNLTSGAAEGDQTRSDATNQVSKLGSAEATGQAVKPKKKAVTISIGSSQPKVASKPVPEAQSSTISQPETDKPQRAPAVKQPEHKAEGFAKKVIELLNTCKGNWRDFISELGRQKLDVKSNSAVLFDIYLCGAIIEGPDTLFFPKDVNALYNVFQAEVPDFVPSSSEEATARNDVDSAQVWSKMRPENVESRLPMLDYVDLFVQTRRRLRYVAAQVESSLVRYLRMSPVLPRQLSDILAAFIGLLLQSAIGSHGSTDLVVPLSILQEERITQKYRGARIFAVIVKSFVGNERELAKVLSKAKLNTPETLTALLPQGQRSLLDLVRFFRDYNISLGEIFRGEEYDAVENEVIFELSKELYHGVSLAIQLGDAGKGGRILDVCLNDIEKLFSESVLAKNIRIPLAATVKAVIEPCAGQTGEALVEHVQKWVNLIGKCGTRAHGSASEVPEARQRVILEVIYAMCAPASKSGQTGAKKGKVVTGPSELSYTDLVANFGGSLAEKTATLLSDKLALLLHPLYDADIDVISEDAIMRWFEETVKAGDEGTLNKIGPYISWLKEAEEESEEED